MNQTNGKIMTTAEQLDWAETLLCNAEPPKHCTPEEWVALVKKWRDEKHVVTSDRTILRHALVGLVGVDGKKDLEAMNEALRSSAAPAEEKLAAVNAVHALLHTLPAS
ncbi:MAG: hypothetical protein ACOYD4_04145 [Solirubrobacterales bacterium]